MRVVIQRVISANVKINNQVKGKIDKGIVVFLGVGTNDSIDNVKKTANKILSLRIFQNDLKKMDYSITDICGSILVISQFTLYGDCLKGNRPSFVSAADPKHANNIYNEFVNYLKGKSLNVQTGSFGAMMSVELINDGPATFTLEY